jgi:hypothetical protein
METLRDQAGETVMLVANEHARLRVHEVVEVDTRFASRRRSDPRSR